MNAEIRTSWEIPQLKTTPQTGQGRSEEDHQLREHLIEQVAAIASRERWTKQEVATRIGMPDGTFSQWYSGKYTGRLDAQNAKVENWLATIEDHQAIERAIPSSPKFIGTRISKEIMDMMQAARALPAMNLITADAGIGKTFTARHFIAHNANTWLVTISPHTKTIHGMLLVVAEAVGISQPNQAKLVSSIGSRIKKQGAPTLLIIDEAQNLSDDSINQLRHFVDNYECGVALLGNNESYSRFTAWGKGTKYGQLRRRILKRLNLTTPYSQDLGAFIKAWGIVDPAMVTFLTGIGLKPGALGQIDMTLKLAYLSAMGQDRKITLADLKKAWRNRDVEG